MRTLDFRDLFAHLAATRLAPHLTQLERLTALALEPTRHGRHAEWLTVLDQLPQAAAEVALDEAAVRAGSEHSLTAEDQAKLREALMGLHPWRKGPWSFHGLTIDTEWHSDWKWQRLAGAITPLTGRKVLDVGCGNGYHGWRMLGAGAALVLGVDPTLLSVVQFQATRQLLGEHWPIGVLPLRLEEMPTDTGAFDTVFSMGVLYHRRSPFDHLFELRGQLRSGGELVLETLVIEGGAGEVLVPPGRYAKMHNVWFIPSPQTLVAWLERAKFRHVRLVDVTPTTTAEQRATEWMRFESLADFLDPADPSRTCEGLPAPRRAVLVAEAP